MRSLSTLSDQLTKQTYIVTEEEAISTDLGNEESLRKWS